MAAHVPLPADRIYKRNNVSTRRTRKQRRAMKAILKHGPHARPAHKSRSGRTGKSNASRLKGLHDAARRRTPREEDA